MMPNHLLKSFESTIIRSTCDEDFLYLDYSTDSGEKYTMVIGVDEVHNTSLGITKVPAPYAIYNTSTSGEPTTEITSLFEWELEGQLRWWGVDREDLLVRIEHVINGDKFYGGVHTNQLVLMRRRGA